jgi:hypothetical protein
MRGLFFVALFGKQLFTIVFQFPRRFLTNFQNYRLSIHQVLVITRCIGDG